jgi:hypothetical protein
LVYIKKGGFIHFRNGKWDLPKGGTEKEDIEVLQCVKLKKKQA